MKVRAKSELKLIDDSEVMMVTFEFNKGAKIINVIEDIIGICIHDKITLKSIIDTCEQKIVKIEANQNEKVQKDLPYVNE